MRFKHQNPRNLAASRLAVGILFLSLFAAGPALAQPGATPGTDPPDSNLEPPVIIGQENLWFSEPRLGGVNYFIEGESILPFEPLLGLTASSDRLAKMQEMQWFFRYTGKTGRNAIFSVEWIAPRDLIDRNLRKTFLPLLEQTEGRWNIFYDPVLASVWRGLGPGPVDFSRPEIRTMFESDLDYFRDKYFDHPNYWRINGKPVMHVWAAKELVRNADDLFRAARRSGIYICGDTFGQRGQEPPLDCRTGFTAATPDIVSRGRKQSVGQILTSFEGYFQNDGGKDLIPAFSFQYDDVEFRTRMGLGGTAIQILANGRGDLRSWLELADRYSKPIDGSRYIWVGTLNGWAEATTIYPTERANREFWQGSEPRKVQPYHYAKLEVMQRTLFPDAPYTGPRVEVGDDGGIIFRDSDIFAGIKITAKLNGESQRIKLDREKNVSFLPNFDRVWYPEVEYDKIVIRVKNLDRRRTKKIIR